jgi:hypothetical protein
MERNGIKGDPFHFMDAYKRTLKKKHGMYQVFSGLMRDAMFMVSKEDMDREHRKLSNTLFGNPNSHCYQNSEKANKEASKRLYCPGSKILDNVPRVIPPPDILLPRIKRAVDLCANAKDATTGEVFFSRKTWKVHFLAMKHFEQGCISDKPGFEYYYFKTSKSGNQKLMCVRGTSALEGFHAHLRRIFPGFHTAPLLATCLLALFVYRWNMDRSTELGLISEEYAGWYSHELIIDMQQLSDEIPGVDHLHEDFVNCEDYVSTGETFFTPIVRMVERLQVEGGSESDSESFCGEEEAGNLSAAMEFAAQRDHEQRLLPITPVLSCERAPIMEIILHHRTSTGSNANQHGSICFDSAVVDWNSLCDDEMAKPPAQRRKMFPKTASLLRSFYKEEKRRENEKKTQRQIVQIREEDGVRQSVVVARGIRSFREEIRNEGMAGIVFAPPRSEPPAMPKSTTVAPGEGDAVAVPPLEIHAARANSVVMDTVQAGHHLNDPAFTAAASTEVLSTTVAPRKRQRCHRCGYSRTGSHHKGKAARNAPEYCTVPVGERFSGWIVPCGYEVGDTRSANDPKTVKREWK